LIGILTWQGFSTGISMAAVCFREGVGLSTRIAFVHVRVFARFNYGYQLFEKMIDDKPGGLARLLHNSLCSLFLT